MLRISGMTVRVRDDGASVGCRCECGMTVLLGFNLHHQRIDLVVG